MSTSADQGTRMIAVEVAYATPERQVLQKLTLAEGSTVQDAIERSDMGAAFPELVIDPDMVGIFGRKVPINRVLRDGDRVEIYRPLIADPKEARRRRALKDS